jgi:hypothetical protein
VLVYFIQFMLQIHKTFLLCYGTKSNKTCHWSSNNTTNKSKSKMIFQNFWTLLCCINIKVQRDFCPRIHEWYHISHISSLHQRATNCNLFWIDHGNNVIEHCIIGNKRYPLLLWLMIPHKKGNVHHTTLEFLFNRNFNRRIVAENSFRILKKRLESYYSKLIYVNINFLYDMVIYYCTLYNMIIERILSNIDTLMMQL